MYYTQLTNFILWYIPLSVLKIKYVNINEYVYSLYILIYENMSEFYIELHHEHYTLNIFISTFHVIICQIYVFIFYDFKRLLFIYLIFGCAGCLLLTGLSPVAASGATFR